jgi:hypothetical protein
MPEPARQKITLAEMRAAGGRGVLIYCSDFHCSHSAATKFETALKVITLGADLPRRLARN